MELEFDDDEESPAFRPIRADENDFRWFFCTIGRKPKLRSLSRGDSRRWKAIDRCLDNRGSALRAFYTNPEKFIEPALAAAPPDGERWLYVEDRWGSTRSIKETWTVDDLKRLDRCRAAYVSSEDDWKFDDAVAGARSALVREYRPYLENVRKGCDLRPKASLAVSHDDLIAVLTANGPWIRGRTEIREGRAGFRIVKEPDTNVYELLISLMGDGVETSTWGDWRVSEVGAARILRMPDAPREILFRELRALCAAAATQRAAQLTTARSDAMPAAPSRRGHQDIGNSGEARPPSPAATTSVRAFARQYGIRLGVVRALLRQNGCSEAMLADGTIPLAWMNGEGGKRVTAALLQHRDEGRTAERQPSRRENRGAFMRSLFAKG